MQKRPVKVFRIPLRNYPALLSYLRECIVPLFDNKSVVLDSGCGAGNSLLFGDMVEQLVGVDLDGAVIRSNKDIDSGVVGDIEELPFADNKFDLVMSVDVMEHLERPDLFVKEVSRVLKRGKYFFFTTPNRKSLFGTAARLLPNKTIKLLTRLINRKATINDVHYYRLNTVSQIEETLMTFGFHDICVVLLDKLPSNPRLRLLLLPDYLLGRFNLIHHYSIGLLCIARKH